MPDRSPAGGILAGGLARRMGGGDKGLLLVGGRSVLQRVIERLAPQVTGLALNANDDPARFSKFGLPIIPDSLPGRLGPLAGVLALLDWAADSEQAEFLVTVAADAPFLPCDLVRRLCRARPGGEGGPACAASGGRTHWVIALWPVRLRGELRRAMTEDGTREVGGFVARQGPAMVEWPVKPVDPFFNVNTPDDLLEANRLAAADAGL